MIMNLQYFGGRGSAAGKRTGESSSAAESRSSSNPTITMSELNTAQRGYVKELESMEINDMITIGGFDFNTLEKAAMAGEEWADSLIDGEYELPGQYIKTGKNTWEAATYESNPARYTKAEMLDIIRRTKKANSKSKRAMEQWLRDIEG